MKSKLAVFIILIITACSATVSAQQIIPLKGTWGFKLDEANVGIKENWATQKFTQTIALPGTTDEAHYGTKTTGSDFGILTRAYKYIGAAWYQKEVTIPTSWKDKHIVLELERVMWQSKLFVDGKEISTLDALSSPHFHNLGNLTPGKHLITIRVDNDLIYNIGDKGHVYTEYTQTIWNGIIGEIQLVAQNKTRFQNPRIDTRIAPRQLIVSDSIINEGSTKKITVNYELRNRSNGLVVYTQQVAQKAGNGKTPLRHTAALDDAIQLWDDAHPNLYELTITITEKNTVLDQFKTEIGFREITTSKSKMLVNGKPVFLRGNLDCVHFPLTGYPSMKVEDWEHIFRIYKSYGLNHARFHSWCPPKEAFIAADRIGIYVMAETIWIDWWMAAPRKDRPEMNTKGYPQGLGKNPSADQYVQQELHNMVKVYGNHPSFAMMCIGNELGNSDFDIMESWIKPIKAADNRRIYDVSTARKITPTDDFIATHNIDKLGATRGLRGGASLDWDFEDVYSKSNIPVIAHEIGQWPVYPLWSEIKKYTGVLKARNFEEFREQARKNKIENQDEAFTAASGALNQLMYKYEIESFLRTPSCAGIQLLSLQDYQGQGEALVGWLDVFYDSKGITTPEKFRMHHDTTVALLRIPKFVYENNETLTGKLQLAHYGTADITDAVYWKVSDDEYNIIDEGVLPTINFKEGTSTIPGKFECKLSDVKKAGKLTIEVGLQNHSVKNTWNIWVYPQNNSEAEKTDVIIANRFDENVVRALEAGKSVLLQASAIGDDLSSDAISFYPLYWSLTFFPGQGKNTIGMLVQDKHPALNHFPTDFHSDWQWQSVYKNAKAFYINDYPENYKPIAQPVDDFHRNNKLASIFELKVGNGRLLVSGFNFDDEKNPVARQLKSSLLQYMNSKEFNPSYEKDIASLRKMFIYTEPLKSQVPAQFTNALLYVEAGANADKKEQNLQWSPSIDKVESRKGTAYKVNAEGVWKDDNGTAWFGKNMEIGFTVPQGFIGSIYVFFHDWNNNGREGAIEFEGRNYTIGRHNKEGIWVKLHVMREDSNDGKLLLKTRSSKGPNLMISKLALMEE
ncbi:MAG: glycoside hydrolase family 2 protein [Niabella sp.]